MNVSEKIFLVALTMIDGLGIQRLRELINHFTTASELWKSNTDDWINVSPQIKDNFNTQRKTIDLNKIQLKLHKEEIQILTYYDNEYPELLKEISSPPLVLYYKGNISLINTRCLGVVGTRKITTYGYQIVRHLIPRLLHAQFTIVSGFQRGVDTAAHTETIQSNGKTIAVLGTGIDVAYPPGNSTLGTKMLKKDNLIITEYPPGTSPLPNNFPRRNRIISGLSIGVLVVEASKDSGSLITANFALEQNREVFAVPGSIFTEGSEGPNYLIQQGAKPILTAEDICQELGVNASPQQKKPSIDAFLTETQKLMYAALSASPIHIDDIIETVPIPSTEVLSELTILELNGHIINLGQGLYVRA